VKTDPISAVSQISAVPTILRVITEMTGLRLSLIAHVTADEWTCCAVNDQLAFGLEVGGHLDVATTLCSDVRKSKAPVIISHASQDPAYCDHRTPKLYDFESYISVPIFLRSGEYFGNVCALDSRPIELKEPKTLALFQLFAELVGLQLEAEDRQAKTSEALTTANESAQLREQFIAVLGHDLRTPMQAISIGAQALAKRNLPPGDAGIVQRIVRSVDRVNHLVDDVLDFARGRLGSGIPLVAAPIADLHAVFNQVIDELRALHPARLIDVRSVGHGGFQGDPVRLAQLLQNLLGNALTHSPDWARIAVEVRLDDRELLLSVANGGPALPQSILSRMFEPFHRGGSGSAGGLGLGLYIAAQIVRSHGGTIEADSTDAATRVTCRLPQQPMQSRRVTQGL